MFEVNVRVIVDTTTLKSAETYRDDLLSSLPSWSEVIAAEGTVKGSSMMPMTTQRDLDAEWDRLIRHAKDLNRYAAAFEEGLVEKRVALTRMFHRELQGLVDQLDARRA